MQACRLVQTAQNACACAGKQEAWTKQSFWIGSPRWPPCCLERCDVRMILPLACHAASTARWVHLARWLPVSVPQSSEIIRMLNSAFNHLAKNPSLDLYPEALRPAIDAVNEWVYKDINNGVYRCGFATSQEAYDTAFK